MFEQSTPVTNSLIIPNMWVIDPYDNKFTQVVPASQCARLEKILNRLINDKKELELGTR